MDSLWEDLAAWDVAVAPFSVDATLRITAVSPGSQARRVAVVRTVEVRNPSQMTGGTYALQGGFWSPPGYLAYVPIVRRP